MTAPAVLPRRGRRKEDGKTWLIQFPDGRELTIREDRHVRLRVQGTHLQIELRGENGQNTMVGLISGWEKLVNPKLMKAVAMQERHRSVRQLTYRNLLIQFDRFYEAHPEVRDMVKIERDMLEERARQEEQEMHQKLLRKAAAGDNPELQQAIDATFRTMDEQGEVTWDDFDTADADSDADDVVVEDPEFMEDVESQYEAQEEQMTPQERQRAEQLAAHQRAELESLHNSRVGGGGGPRLTIQGNPIERLPPKELPPQRSASLQPQQKRGPGRPRKHPR